jgi:hypothetical protein
MFWRRRGRDKTEARPTNPTAPRVGDAQPPAADAEEQPEEVERTGTAPPGTGPIELERDAPRPVAIQHAAEELSRRGDRVVELFKEVRSPKGRANLAIHLKRGSETEEDVFVEVATGPWDDEAIGKAAWTAAILRGSEHAGANLEFLSAYPLPDEVRFFGERSPVALLLLDLIQGDDLQEPESGAETFREAANRHWGLNLEYDTGTLSPIEELLTTALNEEDGYTPPRILDPLVHGLGCYIGEILRRHAPQGGSWRPAGDWGEGIVLELSDLTADPLGQARSFLENGPEDSIAFYAEYVLKELGAAGSSPGKTPQDA